MVRRGAERAGHRRLLGFVYLDSHTHDPFTETDLQVLTVLANFAATKIESARLAEENLAKRRLEQDMRLAADIQASLLPQQSPKVPGYDVAGMTRPSLAVGGAGHDDFLLDGPRLHIALGDVSGKGLGAAMLMVALRATVRADRREERLSSAVARANETFLQSVPIPTSTPRSSWAASTSAANASTTSTPATTGRSSVRPAAWCSVAEGGTIGAFETSVWSEGTVELHPGDTLPVFSDGVSDTWPDAEEADQQLIALSAPTPTGARPRSSTPSSRSSTGSTAPSPRTTARCSSCSGAEGLPPGSRLPGAREGVLSPR